MMPYAYRMESCLPLEHSPPLGTACHTAQEAKPHSGQRMPVTSNLCKAICFPVQSVGHTVLPVLGLPQAYTTPWLVETVPRV